MACDLNVNILGITGDCSNSNLGSFEIGIDGSAPDFTIQWVNPNLGTIALSGATGYTISSLSAGTYTFNVLDSCISGNTVYPINVYISSGTCVTITDIDSTLCSLNNGSLTATTENLYDTATFDLYELSTGLVQSQLTFDDTAIFTSLSAGTYYVIANDGGGCTGKTQSCIIKSSTTLSYGFYTINDAGCGVNSGAIYITGLTGVAPYTYLWTNGETTQSVTGLTQGNYSVTVTDSTGCATTQSTTITQVPNVGLGAFISTSPTCFNSDGEVTVFVTGGTAPYYYSGSNGETVITFSDSKTFSNLPSGYFSVSVTDAGLCSFVASTTLLTPNSFSILSVSTTDTTCSNLGGEISFSLLGGSPPYTYTLSGATTLLTTTTNTTNWTFNGLESGLYLLTISDNGSCVYSGTYIVNNVTLFNLSASTTGTTCNNSDGSVLLSITTGGTAPYTYEIDGSVVTTNDLNYLFENLSSGNYTTYVTDANLCQQILPITINSSSSVDFILVPTDLVNGGDGYIDVFITDGEPPFTLEWSDNVPTGQTGTTITGLTAGTYTLTVTDSNGCVQLRTIDVTGYNKVTSYELFNICDIDFSYTGILGKNGIQQMLVEGFYDVTTGDTNCIINTAIFEANVEVDGVSTGQTFYTGTSLNDFPADNLFYDTVEDLLLSYDGISEVIIDEVENKITITTICNPGIELIGSTVIITLKIYYDINCVSCS